MSENPPTPNASTEATVNPTTDAERIIKEQRVVTDGQEHTTQFEETTVVVPTAATLERRRFLRVRRTIYTIVSIIAIFIFIRILLTLFGADPLNGFASFIYAITFPFVLPFRDLFGPGREPQLGVNIFDASSVVAIAIYYLFAWIGVRIAKLTYLRTRTEPTEVRTTVR